MAKLFAAISNLVHKNRQVSLPNMFHQQQFCRKIDLLVPHRTSAWNCSRHLVLADEEIYLSCRVHVVVVREFIRLEEVAQENSVEFRKLVQWLLVLVLVLGYTGAYMESRPTQHHDQNVGT